MKLLGNFINMLLTRYLVNKTYKAEMKNIGEANKAQIEILFANDGIELH